LLLFSGVPGDISLEFGFKKKKETPVFFFFVPFFISKREGKEKESASLK